MYADTFDPYRTGFPTSLDWNTSPVGFVPIRVNPRNPRSKFRSPIFLAADYTDVRGYIRSISNRVPDFTGLEHEPGWFRSHPRQSAKSAVKIPEPDLFSRGLHGCTRIHSIHIDQGSG